MRNQRVTEDELWPAVRKHDVGSVEQVKAIVLESSGEVSVIKEVGDETALGELPAGRTDHLSGCSDLALSLAVRP